MKLNLRDLEYFVAVAQLQHFGKAAEQLGVTQPTLSMQLKKLEYQLGGQLIERTPGKILVTALGTSILLKAREIMRLSSEIESCISNKFTMRPTRIGVIPTISPYLLPRINKGLSNRLKGRKMSFLEGQTSDLVRLVREGTTDVAIVSTPLRKKGLEEIEIYSEPFFLAVNNTHVLAKSEKVSLREIKNEKLLLLGEGHCLRNQALALCKISQETEDTDLSATSIETLKSMVATGTGMTLVPKLAARKEDGISYLRLSENSANRRVGLIYRSSYADVQFIHALVEIIRETAGNEKLALLKEDGKS